MTHQIIEIIPTQITVAPKSIQSKFGGELKRVLIHCSDGVTRQYWPKAANLETALTHFVAGQSKAVRIELRKNDDGSTLEMAQPATGDQIKDAKKNGGIPPAPPMTASVQVAAPSSPAPTVAPAPSPVCSNKVLAAAALQGTIELIKAKEISISGLETSTKKLYKILLDVVNT